MKHIKTYSELNEGWFDWLWKKTYRVNFTAELKDKETDKEFSWRSHIVVKAKDEDEAEEKFYDKWEDATKKMKDEPTVIVGTIKKTSKTDKLNIEFPKNYLTSKRDIKKEVKKEEAKKEVKKEIKKEPETQKK